MERSEQHVTTVADARARLSEILRAFRADPDHAKPVVLGSHRRPEAVLMPIAQFERSEHADAPAGQVFDDLVRRRKLVLRLARANHISEVKVFGSVARREESSASDIDLLVEPAEDATLFDLAQFEIDLEALFDRPVDVISRRALDPARDAGILAEARSI
ncbi:nucleotidyltransferase domain-containing protein [Agromyces neolithicus]|uniref:Polymerase beta nucleotidyltransferase domain-containing protein n=1 Tax=Agromyces neolithicus TaxID=269420 RepID=A0ABN2M8B2_9MICO